MLSWSWKYSILTILHLILSIAVGKILVCTIVMHSEWKVEIENKILVFLVEVKVIYPLKNAVQNKLHHNS